MFTIDTFKLIFIFLDFCYIITKTVKYSGELYMNRKERKLKNKRLFIDAAMKLIEDEGVEGVSIRKVATITGYNSATLYSYFQNLDHLILLACIKFLKEYVDGLDKHIAKAKDDLEKFQLIWDFFCTCSFKKPEIYQAVFFSKLDFSRSDFENFYEIKEFYEIYPEEINESFTRLHRMILKLDIYERNKILLIDLARKGFISPSHINTINNMQVLIYKGLLEQAVTPKQKGEEEILKRRAIKYIRHCIDPFIISKK